MKNKPLLSIIIPTFNSESTIFKTLDSIVNQSYKNIEVLIFDSNSIDKTVEIAKKFNDAFLEFKIVSKKDKGVYDAMNNGVKSAKGNYLYFMGSDDVFYDNSVLDQVFLENNIKNDIIYGNVLFKHSQRIYSGSSSLEKLRVQEVSICHQAIFYSHKVFEIIGNYSLKYFIHADYDFNIRCFKNSQISIKFIDVIIAIFNEKGMSGLQSNADGFHTELKEEVISENHSLVSLYEENILLNEKIKRIQNSKAFRVGSAIIQPIKMLKKVFK